MVQFALSTAYTFDLSCQERVIVFSRLSAYKTGGYVAAGVLRLQVVFLMGKFFQNKFSES